MKKVYLDYAGTTPIDEEVAQKLKPFLSEVFGNPSSLHSFGQEALFAIDKARKTVADFFGALESEVFFTSSATQANNIAILGAVKNIENPHIITTAFEHKAVLETVKNSGAEVSILSVYKNGVIKKEDLLKEIKENTALITIGYVNSEVGTVQPIKEISEIIKEENKKRKKGIIFHTDAVQAINYFDCNVESLGVDMLTLSGHKIYGPKGAGALYIRKGTKISPIFYGASQESGVIPGTENVFAIAGLGFAIEKIKENDIKKTKALRDTIINTVLTEIPGTKLNGDREKRVPNNVNITFKGVEGESLMLALDVEGIAVSTGSACASKSLSPSYVLLAMGLSHEEAHSSLRVSLGRLTTQEEVDYFLEKLKGAVKKLRLISGA
jgi:cysteine desulfurase